MKLLLKRVIKCCFHVDDVFASHCYKFIVGNCFIQSLVICIFIKGPGRCRRLSLPGGLSLPEAAITIAGTNPNPEP